MRARTKIVATVGPACLERDQLAALTKAGVDVFRLNMAHGDLPQHSQTMGYIRDISQEIGSPIGVLVDLAGPKIRLGELFEDPTTCAEGAEFQFVRGEGSSSRNIFTSNYERLVDELDLGNSVMLADGTVAMEVVAKSADAVTCRVRAGGMVRSRQGINLPGAKLSVPAMTAADWKHAEWAAENGADFVSLSFVRAAAEIESLKKHLRDRGSRAMVIAKIEKAEALENLDAIVGASDGVMVARGDLGVETDVAETPVAQKRIIACCQRHFKPVIVATQMLDSMTHSPRPTRAETTDVANAILDGADACMLSGETAVGEYPRETVMMMNRIMQATEKLMPRFPDQAPISTDTSGVHAITAAVVYGATRITARLGARMIVIATRHGGTARVKAKLRDVTPTIGVSDNEATLRQMCLFWGIIPLRHQVSDGAELRKFVAEWGKRDGVLQNGDRVVFVTGSALVPQAHNIVAVHEVD